jgi:hypothetical protein
LFVATNTAAAAVAIAVVYIHFNATKIYWKIFFLFIFNNKTSWEVGVVTKHNFTTLSFENQLIIRHIAFNQ